MKTERTNFEVFDWMKEHQKEKDYSDTFIDAYKYSYFLGSSLYFSQVA